MDPHHKEMNEVLESPPRLSPTSTIVVENPGSIDLNGKELAGVSEKPAQLSPTSTIAVENYEGLRASAVLVYLSICFFMFTLCMMVIAAALFARPMAAIIGGVEASVFLTQSITIVGIVFGPILPQAADCWGRKWILVSAISCGVIGSIVVSRAQSMATAIVGTTLCGWAYSAQPLSCAVASEILPRRFRTMVQAGINISIAIGGIVGLLGGSAMVEDYPEGFRYFWYMVIGLLAISTLLLATLYSPPPTTLQQSLTFKEKLGQLDWVAYALLTPGVVLFIIALSWADNPYPWHSAEVLAPLLIGIAFLIALGVQQIWFKKDGLFHHELFKRDRNFGIALFLSFFDGLVYFAANNYFTYEVSVLWETSLIRTGLRFCVAFFAAIVAAAAVSAYSAARKTVKGAVVGSFVLFVAFFVCMATTEPGSSTAVWVYAVILGGGIGISLTSLVTVAQLSSPPDLIATSSGIQIAVRSLGGAVSVGICTAEFSSLFSSHLGEDVASEVVPLGLSSANLPAFIKALLSGSRDKLMAIPGVTPQIIAAGTEGLQHAYILSFRVVWITVAILSLIAAIVSCFLIDPKKDFTMHVDAPLEKKEDLFDQVKNIEALGSSPQH